MEKYAKIAAQLEARLAELGARAERIEEDLRTPLDADFAEQASELADDEALEGVDDILRGEAAAVRAALMRIENGTYGACVNCGAEIPEARLEVQPTATACVKCAA